MKRIFFVFAILLWASSALADEYVDGYVRADGGYVEPHFRSSPDGNPFNNYSTQGNVNPYTGQEGHRNPDSHMNYPSSDRPPAHRGSSYRSNREH